MLCQAWPPFLGDPGNTRSSQVGTELHSTSHIHFPQAWARGEVAKRKMIVVLQTGGLWLMNKKILSEVIYSKDISEAGLDPGTLMPKLSPALILDTKRCCGDGENRMQNRPKWGGWG